MFTAKMRAVFIALMFLVGTVDAQGGLITEIVGDIQMFPVSITMDSPDASSDVGGGIVHVVGSHNGRPALQILNLNTQSVGSIQFFDSLASAAGGTGDNSGKIREVRRLENGNILYVGDSAGSVDPLQPTSWLTPNDPQGGVGPTGTPVAGAYHGISQNGVIIGNPNAVYATHGNLPKSLPGGGISALDITRDASFIAGDFLWKHNGLGYDVFDTSGFAGEDATWKGVAIDPVLGSAIFAGEFFSLTSFSNETGFWREDGSFLFSAGANSTFTDFEVYDGQLVAAINGLDDSSLFAITDGSFLSLESILGSKMLLADDGLFVGSVGWIGSDASGNSFAATASAVPASADFDDDGDVDGHDFLKWQRGQSPSPMSAEDLALWEAQFGVVASLESSFAAIPEPSTFFLATLGVSLVCLCSRDRKRSSEAVFNV